MHPIKKIAIVVILYMLSGCATISKNYNTPFINTDETITLEYGMKKSTVLNNLGYPLYVDRGDRSLKEIVWVYEVRTIEVKSDILMGGKISVAKISVDTKHAGPIHRLELVFVDNRLSSWGPSDEEEEEDEQEEIADNSDSEEVVKKEKKIKLFLMPKISFLMQGYEYETEDEGYVYYDQEGYYWETNYSTESGSFTSPSGGVYLGIESKGGIRFGAEGRLGFKNSAIMGVLELPLPVGVSLLIGGGIDYASDDSDKAYGERANFFKVGIAKSINERISGTVEIYPFFTDDSYRTESGFGILFSGRLHL